MLISKVFKRFACLVTFLCCSVYLTGCSASVASPVLGVLYTSVKGPVTATGSKVSSGWILKGEGTAISYFGLIAVGDASIDGAAKRAGIDEIRHVDYHSRNILGIISTYTVIVHGYGRSSPIQTELGFDPFDPNNWTITPLPGAEVWFEIGLEFQNDLDNLKFTDELRAGLLNHGFILSENANILVGKEKGGGWFIFDEKSKRTFLIKKGVGKLMVGELMSDSLPR